MPVTGVATPRPKQNAPRSAAPRRLASRDGAWALPGALVAGAHAPLDADFHIPGPAVSCVSTRIHTNLVRDAVPDVQAHVRHAATLWRRSCSPRRGPTACQICPRSYRYAHTGRQWVSRSQSGACHSTGEAGSAVGRLQRSAPLYAPNRAAATRRRAPWGAEQTRRVACSAAS